MGYVLIGILVILVLAAGLFFLRRNPASPYHGESDGDGGSALGDTTEHSSESSAAHSPQTSRRG